MAKQQHRTPITDEARAILGGRLVEDCQPEPATNALECPSFPDSAWRGLFADYRAVMDGTTEACDVSHFATFWSVAAAALGRRVWMQSGDTVYPNVYLCVFGESGDKKTTAERRISSCNLLEHHPAVKIIRGVGSTEGMAEALTEEGKNIHLFFWEEFASLLSRARWSGSTLLEFITEAFDCPTEWKAHYRKNNKIELEEPTPSILTATTTEWFWKYAKAEDFFGGFGNRIFFFTGPKKAPLPNPDAIDGKKIHDIKERLKLVAQHKQGAEWTTDARKIWDAFYMETESGERTGLLGAALKRAHVYVRKLAMTYAALEQTLPHIDSDQLRAAIAVVRYGMGCTERLIELQAAQSKPQGELEQRFLKWIAAHEGERVRRLQQLMWKYCGDSDTFNKVVRSLREADRIDIDKERRVFLSR